MQLNLFIDGKRVATLSRVNLSEGGLPDLHYQFQYLNTANSDDFVALNLPVRAEPYHTKRLPAFLDMLLPEGDRLTTIAKLVSGGRELHELELLNLVGKNTVGRVQISDKPTLHCNCLELDEPLESCCEGQKLFDKLMRNGGYQSGISGVQEKVMPLEEDLPTRRTAVASTQIIKTSTENFPTLSINEHICLTAARAAGIAVPDHVLSADGVLIGIDRFDILPDQSGHKGFDEINAMVEQSAHQKYEGSYDVVAYRIEDYSDDMLSDLESLYRQMLFNSLIGNGDAHMKNYGLLYHQGSARLSPAYDLVSTQVYEPNDIPALALSQDNYSKRWWALQELEDFGFDYCYLDSEKMQKDIYPDMQKALNSALKETRKMIETHTYFEEDGRRLQRILVDNARRLGLKADSELTPSTDRELSQ